ncbi:D-alanine---D-serine ligase [Natranaerovirga hydrolytica]|uniref:D-alanine--D-alanine ligase n=1 Tax=Natranaerovirga hydrolytica TaxID=680378 RepID=A0A4R1MZL0_9FIRM|nr:D-alanine--D-serine ligase VanG [Natranaerovirga hydrolytica]TCK98012.1 D-alanine---D-serine ligase [Natranaerovirga hydrolytica]
MKKKVAILFGGASSEYLVSLVSASAVIANINTEKYELILIGITKKGEWLRYNGPIHKIEEDTWYDDDHCLPVLISPSKKMQGIIEIYKNTIKKVEVDVIFPVLHGKNGEDGTMQGLLELSGIPFIGCKTLSSAICMDKDIAHSLAQAKGVKIPGFVTLRSYDDLSTKVKEAEKLGYPLFVKPAKAGSSFGITKANTSEGLIKGIEEGFKHDDKVVVEEHIEGFEVGCAILGTEQLIVGAVDEIELSQGFFDFTEKYTLQSSKIHVPARISKENEEKIKNVAKHLYRILECTGFARVDMFLTPQGEIVFNEINTIPGFTAHSRYPNMLKEIGISYSELIDTLIELV